MYIVSTFVLSNKKLYPNTFYLSVFLHFFEFVKDTGTESYLEGKYTGTERVHQRKWFLSNTFLCNYLSMHVLHDERDTCKDFIKFHVITSHSPRANVCWNSKL